MDGVSFVHSAELLKADFNITDCLPVPHDCLRNVCLNGNICATSVSMLAFPARDVLKVPLRADAIRTRRTIWNP